MTALLIAFRSSRWIVLGLLFVVAATVPVSGGYSVTDLGVLPGGTESDGAALNVFGTVVGRADDGLHFRAVMGSSGGLRSIGTLPGGQNSEALAITDSGRVAGASEVSVATATGQTIQTHAFVTTTQGAIQDYGTFAGDIGSKAYGVNEGGTMAGVSLGLNGSSRAVTASSPNSFVDLGTLGGQFAGATAINNNHVVTGWAQLASGMNHAFVTGSNGLQDLGVLPGFGSSEGRAINLAGQIVGFSGSLGSSDAFLYTPGRPSLLDLGVLPFGISSAAFALNNFGAIVGRVDYNSGPSHAFAYDPVTQRMIDVNGLISSSPGFLVTSATGINDHYQIAGTALFGSQVHAVLLTPKSGERPFDPPTVPEPGSWLLLACGGGIVAAWVKCCSPRSG